MENINDQYFIDQKNTILIFCDSEIIKNEEESNYPSLEKACQNGNYEVVKLLLKNGANVQTNLQKPLLSACVNGHLKIVKLLAKYGAEVDGSDLLAESFKNGHFEVADFLIDSGVRTWMAADSALETWSEIGNLEIVKRLVSWYGADRMNHNYIALINSCYNGHLDIVKYLVERGADVHVSNNDPLIESLYGGHSKVAKYLLSKSDFTPLDDHTAELLVNLNIIIDNSGSSLMEEKWGQLILSRKKELEPVLDQLLKEGMEMLYRPGSVRVQIMQRQFETKDYSEEYRYMD